MDIGLTDEQQLLRDAVAKLGDACATTNPDAVASGRELDRQWQQVVGMGVPTLRSPDLCGLDASGVETAIVIEELARALCAIPALGQAVLATEMFQAANAEKELEGVAEGTLRVAPVLSTGLTELDSSPGVAFDAAGATHAIATVKSGETRQLLMGALADAPAAGLDLTRDTRTVPADFIATATAVGEPIDAQRWQKVTSLAMVAVTADLVGVMQGALDDAVRYAGDRAQFGVRIGTFQAIQHILADALVRLEGARSCLWHAAWAIDRLPATEALVAAMAGKAYAADAGRDVVEASVQVFGGIAITWEHVSHLRVRRMLLNRRLFGDETQLYDAIAAMRIASPEMA